MVTHNTVDSGLQAPVLIGIIAEIWVLKSERVLINENIEATPINQFYVHATSVRAYPCTWPSTYIAAS